MRRIFAVSPTLAVFAAVLVFVILPAVGGLVDRLPS